MREIKFRVWCPIDKHMYYANPHFCLTFNGRVENLQNGMEGNDYILMQYTGLKDKNGKEIYEGDILRCNFQEREIGIMQYCENGFWIEWPSGTRSLPNETYREVIGNVYENPELLVDLPKTA